ncbi:MAG: hypothetical protein GX087_09305 [Desulfobulbaceae bacterium]|nr:hypothetical protein [Desulfobulbaceae bacterium]
MTTQLINKTKSKEKTDSSLIFSKFTVNIVFIMATMIGIWAAACLVGGLISAGSVGELLNGFINAITGK